MVQTQHSMKNKHNRGFTLLLAALISSIVLSLGVAVFSIAQKQLILTSQGRFSQVAFYAADSAAECALYWDMRYQYFGITPAVATPRCDGQQWTTTLTGNRASGNYRLDFSYAPNGYCATVSVTKAQSGSGVITTIIHADGYSAKVSTSTPMATIVAACTAAIQNDPNILERSVELRY